MLRDKDSYSQEHSLYKAETLTAFPYEEQKSSLNFYGDFLKM